MVLIIIASILTIAIIAFMIGQMFLAGQVRDKEPGAWHKWTRFKNGFIPVLLGVIIIALYIYYRLNI